jgi:hypothetical protein
MNSSARDSINAGQRTRISVPSSQAINNNHYNPIKNAIDNHNDKICKAQLPVNSSFSPLTPAAGVARINSAPSSFGSQHSHTTVREHKRQRINSVGFEPDLNFVGSSPVKTPSRVTGISLELMKSVDDENGLAGKSFAFLLRDDCPNVFMMIKLFIVLPVTTATAERSFSQLRRLKTYLRSTMGEKNLQLNGMMAIHKEEVDVMDPEEIADEFIGDNNYRKQVFGPPGFRSE